MNLNFNICVALLDWCWN